jgi:hypothetical protein
MCDRIREDETRYEVAKRLVQEGGCQDVNEELTQCLTQNKHDWGKCQA